MTAHNLIYLSSKVYNTPHLITQEQFTPILNYLSNRNSGNVEFVAQKVEPSSKKPVKIVDKYGELSINGALTYKPVNMMCSDGGTSYQQLLIDAEELIASGVKVIVMTHDSGGGEAAHMMSTADRLRELADQNGVKLISYIDTLSASAALGLGIVADEVIIHPEAKTGSIGAVVALLDNSKALAEAGLKPIFISSTEGKVPYAEDGSFTKKFLDNMQEQVTALGNKFANHVHKYSGIPVEDILALDAQVYNAEDALKLGLVNKIMNHQQFYEYLSTL